MISPAKFNSLLIHTCDIYKKTAAQNPLTGEIEASWNVASTSVPCLIQPITGTQANEIQGLELVAQYKGFFKDDVDVLPKDKILFDGKFFIVAYIFKGWEGGAHHKEILLGIEVSTDEI